MSVVGRRPNRMKVEGEPGAALAEVRGRYEALVGEPNPRGD